MVLRASLGKAKVSLAVTMERAPLTESASVSVLRTRANLSSKWLSYGYASALPVGVSYRSGGRSNFKPIIDVPVVLSIVTPMLWLLTRASKSRRGKRSARR